MLCRFGNNPGLAYWKGVQHLLQYLKRTTHHGLVYRRTGHSLTSTGYCDADWGSEMEKRWSTSAYVFLLAGAAVPWHSKLQTSCAQSTCEAEKVAICTEYKSFRLYSVPNLRSTVLTLACSITHRLDLVLSSRYCNE